MRKIWLLLVVFLFATGTFATTLLVTDSLAVAQSPPSPTEEAQEEGQAEDGQNTATPESPPPIEATGAITGNDVLADPEVMTGTGEMTSTEEVTGAKGIIDIEGMTGTEVITGTEEVTGAKGIIDIEVITGTEMITDIEEITDTQGVTGTEGMTGTEAMTQPLMAFAELQDVDGNIVGTATFTEELESGTVDLRVELSGLMVMTPGEHGIHVHQIGLCAPEFTAAGAHFNPNMAEHGLENPDGPHNGDLRNIVINEEGNAVYIASTNLFTLSEGPRSLLKTDGSALMIHAKPDDHMTDPSGNSGDRIACGVIMAEGAPTAEPPSPPSPVEVASVQPAQRSPTPERIAQLQVAEGFTVTVFAESVANVRMLAQDENGTIYATRPAQGDVIALMDEDGDGAADGSPITATSELTLVHGIVFTGNQVYLATPTTIYRGEVMGDGTFGELETLVDDLPTGGQHPRRTMAFGPDGMLYISVGSPCNECLDDVRERATILQVQPDGSTRTIFADGLRNTLGFGWHPETGKMWGMDQGADWHGNDVPAEELNKIEEGNNYGYPFCLSDNQVNEYIATDPPSMTKAEFCALATAPVLTYTAHSSPIGMVFYTGDQFPEEYRNDAFIAMRGSWNRMPATGYKIVRLHFDEEGQPAEFEDFVTGFLIEDGMAHFGRVAGLLVLQDGSLLIAEDTNGMIYRVSYAEADE